MTLSGAIGWDSVSAIEVLDHHRSILGERGLVGNDSWRTTGYEPAQAYADVHAAIARLGGGHAELATDVRVGSHAGAIEAAIGAGCVVVELMPPAGSNPHWAQVLSPDQLAEFDRRLRENGGSERSILAGRRPSAPA